MLSAAQQLLWFSGRHCASRLHATVLLCCATAHRHAHSISLPASTHESCLPLHSSAAACTFLRQAILTSGKFIPDAHNSLHAAHVPHKQICCHKWHAKCMLVLGLVAGLHLPLRAC